MCMGNVRIGQGRNCLRRLPLAALGAETVADLGQNFDQEVDLGGRVVEVKTRPSAGRDSEAIVQGPCAMVARTDGDALQVEQLGDVVRVGLVERETDKAGTIAEIGTEDVEAVD